MKQRQWKVVRRRVRSVDAQYRWDRSYQYLIQWSALVLSEQPNEPFSQEKPDESCLVCAGFDPATGTGSDD
jgi:hypothetical protein